MGTEAFWVPALLSAAGSGASYINQQQANNRAQGAQVQNIEEQEATQQKANSEVNALTKQVAQNSPQTLADQLTGNLISTLRKNSVGAQTGSGTTGSPINFGASTSGLPANVGGSNRYNSDVANTQTQVDNYGNQEAKLMGNIEAPTRQRQNEGLAMQTLGSNLNLLSGQSYTQNFVNQLRSQAAGQQNPWLTLLSGAASGAGSTLSKNWGAGTGTGAAANGLNTGWLSGTPPITTPINNPMPSLPDGT